VSDTDTTEHNTTEHNSEEDDIANPMIAGQMRADTEGDDSPTQTDSGPIPVSDDELTEAVEAVLMVADQPVSVVSLAQVTNQPTKKISDTLSALKRHYDGDDTTTRRGFELREVGGGWRIYARRDWDELIMRFVHDDSPQRLSQAALETLAVVAYKQPVTRPQVSAVRAVNVDSVMRTLLARGLITEASTDPETGAIFYETTPLLLEYLGIESIADLPPLSPLLDDGSTGFDDVDS
jgi:segregation and condensation protein B